VGMVHHQAVHRGWQSEICASCHPLSLDSAECAHVGQCDDDYSAWILQIIHPHAMAPMVDCC
jgi:hypothetical protein